MFNVLFKSLSDLKVQINQIVASLSGYACEKL